MALNSLLIFAPLFHHCVCQCLYSNLLNSEILMHFTLSCISIRRPSASTFFFCKSKDCISFCTSNILSPILVTVVVFLWKAFVIIFQCSSTAYIFSRFLTALSILAKSRSLSRKVWPTFGNFCSMTTKRLVSMRYCQKQRSQKLLIWSMHELLQATDFVTYKFLINFTMKNCKNHYSTPRWPRL